VYDVVVKKLTFAISFPDEFLVSNVNKDGELAVRRKKLHFVLKLKQEPQTNGSGNTDSSQAGSLATHDQSTPCPEKKVPLYFCL